MKHQNISVLRKVHFSRVWSSEKRRKTSISSGKSTQSNLNGENHKINKKLSEFLKNYNFKNQIFLSQDKKAKNQWITYHSNDFGSMKETPYFTSQMVRGAIQPLQTKLDKKGLLISNLVPLTTLLNKEFTKKTLNRIGLSTSCNLGSASLAYLGKPRQQLLNINKSFKFLGKPTLTAGKESLRYYFYMQMLLGKYTSWPHFNHFSPSSPTNVDYVHFENFKQNSACKLNYSSLTTGTPKHYSNKLTEKAKKTQLVYLTKFAGALTTLPKTFSRLLILPNSRVDTQNYFLFNSLSTKSFLSYWLFPLIGLVLINNSCLQNLTFFDKQVRDASVPRNNAYIFDRKKESTSESIFCDRISKEKSDLLNQMNWVFYNTNTCHNIAQTARLILNQNKLTLNLIGRLNKNLKVVSNSKLMVLTGTNTSMLLNSSFSTPLLQSKKLKPVYYNWQTYLDFLKLNKLINKNNNERLLHSKLKNNGFQNLTQSSFDSLVDRFSQLRVSPKVLSSGKPETSDRLFLTFDNPSQNSFVKQIGQMDLNLQKSYEEALNLIQNSQKLPFIDLFENVNQIAILRSRANGLSGITTKVYIPFNKQDFVQQHPLLSYDIKMLLKPTPKDKQTQELQNKSDLHNCKINLTRPTLKLICNYLIAARFSPVTRPSGEGGKPNGVNFQLQSSNALIQLKMKKSNFRDGVPRTISSNPKLQTTLTKNAFYHYKREALRYLVDNMHLLQTPFKSGFLNICHTPTITKQNLLFTARFIPQKGEGSYFVQILGEDRKLKHTQPSEIGGLTHETNTIEGSPYHLIQVKKALKHNNHYSMESISAVNRKFAFANATKVLSTEVFITTQDKMGCRRDGRLMHSYLNFIDKKIKHFIFKNDLTARVPLHAPLASLDSKKMQRKLSNDSLPLSKIVKKQPHKKEQIVLNKGYFNTVSVLFKHYKMFKKRPFLSETSSHLQPGGLPTISVSYTQKRHETRLYLQKKRKAKKQRLETRRQKKRTRFFPRPTWLRTRLFADFLNKANNKKNSNKSTALRQIPNNFQRYLGRVTLSASGNGTGLAALKQPIQKENQYALKSITTSLMLFKSAVKAPLAHKFKLPSNSHLRFVYFKFKNKKIALKETKYKTNYVNFKSQSQNNPPNQQSNTSLATMYRDFWVWLYNNTVTNKYNNLLLTDDIFSTLKSKTGLSRNILNYSDGLIGQPGLSFSLKQKLVYWALNKTNNRYSFTPYTKRTKLWGIQKMRNQSKNNKTVLLTKQLITSWNNFLLNKNLNTFNKKISAKMQISLQKLNYLNSYTGSQEQSKLRNLALGQLSYQSPPLFDGLVNKSQINPINLLGQISWWSGLNLPTLSPEVVSFSAAKANSIIPDMGLFYSNLNNNINLNYGLFMSTAVLFHFCALISLISISQLRCFIKFHVIVLYKVSNVYSSLLSQIGNSVNSFIFSIFKNKVNSHTSKPHVAMSRNTKLVQKIQVRNGALAFTSRSIPLSGEARSDAKAAEGFNYTLAKNTETSKFSNFYSKNNNLRFNQPWLLLKKDFFKRNQPKNKRLSSAFSKRMFGNIVLNRIPIFLQPVYSPLYGELLKRVVLSSSQATNQRSRNYSLKNQDSVYYFNSKSMQAIDKGLKNNKFLIYLLNKLVFSLKNEGTHNILLIKNKVSKSVLNMIDLVQYTLRSIASFFEKPTELTTTWIAYCFLIEWSSDLKTIIPDNFDIYVWNSFYKLIRTTPISVLSLNVNQFPTIFYFITLSHLMQHRVIYLFDFLLKTISQPDADLLRRQQKGHLFWDLWADFLLNAADKYNVNIAALSTIKAEQNNLIEKISNDEIATKTKSFSSPSDVARGFFSLTNSDKPGLFNILENKFVTGLFPLEMQNRWSVSQFITYQSWNNNSDLFIDYHPPKSFSHLATIKYNSMLQQPIGTLACQIYAGIFTKQISKNILLVNTPQPKRGLSNGASQKIDYNTFLIQALAGETELKIITDNAQRYAVVNRGFAIGIKLLRDVFDKIKLNTPCIFLLEDIHAIGERRPMLISEYGGEDNKTNNELFMNQRDEVHEKNQVIYQNFFHAITHYKKPFKGDYSLAIPTNKYLTDLYKYIRLQSTSNLTLTGNNNSTLKAKIEPPQNENDGRLKNTETTYATHLEIPKKQSLLTPPNTSPFSVLLLKDSPQDLKKKTVQEFPFIGFPGEQLSSKPRVSYSVRAKVAMLAELALSNLSAKLDMITDLLVIIDSVRSNRGFVVFATTDMPQILDPALRRPGRLDETICMPSILTSPVLNTVANYEILQNVTLRNNHLTRYYLPSPVNLLKNTIGVILPPFNPEISIRLSSNINYDKAMLQNGFLTINVHDYGSILNLNYALLSRSNVLLKRSIGSPYITGKNTLNVFDSREKHLKNAIQKNQTKKQKNKRYFPKLKSIIYYEVGKSLLSYKLATFSKTNSSLDTVSNPLQGVTARMTGCKPQGGPHRGANNTNINSVTIKNTTPRVPISSASFNLITSKFNQRDSMLQAQKTLSQQINYLAMFGEYIHLVEQLITIFSGQMSVHLSSGTSQIVRGVLAKEGANRTIALDMYSHYYNLASQDNNNAFQLATSLMLTFVQKRFLYHKNLIAPKLLSFMDGTIFDEPPSPPFSSLLIPAKRYENYNRVLRDSIFGEYLGLYTNRKAIDYGEKIQFYTQLNAIKKLNRNDSTVENNIKELNHENAIKKLYLFGSTMGQSARNHNSLQTTTNINWYYQNRILKRHSQYLTNQWWNGQLSEHNAESVFLSDIDWRSSFIKPLGRTKDVRNLAKNKTNLLKSNEIFSGTNLTKNISDILLDFPDADQHYNPRRRRWLLNKGYWGFWFNFDQIYAEQIVKHLVLDSFIKTYKYLYNNGELLDYMTAKYFNRGYKTIHFKQKTNDMTAITTWGVSPKGEPSSNKGGQEQTISLTKNVSQIPASLAELHLTNCVKRF